MPEIFALTHCDYSGTLLVVSADSAALRCKGFDRYIEGARVVYPAGYQESQVEYMVRGTYESLPAAMRGLQLELRELLIQVESGREKIHDQLRGAGSGSPAAGKKVLGVDFHRVISEADSRLSRAMEMAVGEGHQVHIMTGSRKTPELVAALKDCGFEEGKNFTGFFSIQDHLDSVGEVIHYDENGMPHADALSWDLAKSEYALATGMSAVWDDSPSYCRYMPSSCWYFTYSPEKVEEQVRMVLDGTRARVGRAT